MNQKKHTLHVEGMHCKSCIFLVQDTVSEINGIQWAKVNLKHQTVEIISTDETVTQEDLLAMMNPLLEPHWYSIHTTPPQKTTNWWEYILAGIIALALIYGFVQLQQLGLLQMLHAENRTYGTSFLIGMIASVSSCLAVVGWVVLALWTVFSENTSFRPHSLFHVWRLIWFFILWGMLWLIWAAFQLSQNVSTVLNMIIALVLFILWLNLLWVVRGWVAFWWGIFKRFNAKGNTFLWPLVIGIGTFFLPCGFTQSMQVYTLSTGSFLVWGLTMLSFALGTLPMLLLLSVTWKSIQKSQSSNLFFKTIGIILIVLALYNFLSSLVALGVIPPFFSL